MHCAEGGRAKRILGITRPRSFEFRRHGPNQVSADVKEYMNYALFTGMTAGGIFIGEPVPLLVDGIPHIANIPSFKLKDVDEAVFTRLE